MGWFRHRSALGTASRIALILACFSVLWIGLTDRILGWLVRDAETLLRLATYKGMVYVVLMAMLVFWLSYLALQDAGERAPTQDQGVQPLGLWAPLTIFAASAFLLGLVGYVAFQFQSLALKTGGHDPAGVVASLARTAWTGAALGVIFLALAGILLTVWWRREQVRVRTIHAHLDEERLSLKQQLELLSGYTNDIVLIMDEEQRIVGANDRAIEAYGYPRQELLALGVADLREGKARSDAPDQFKAALAGGSLKFETVHRRKDGTLFPVEVSSRRFEQAGRTFIQSVVRDTTERQESESQFRAIFEQADVGMVECSTQGRFLRANPKFCEFVGYSEAELMALTFMDITHAVHREEDSRAIGAILSGQREGYRTMKRYTRKDGGLVWGRTSVSPVREVDGKPRRLIAAIQDIDVWRHTEERLQESETLVQRILDTTPNLIYIYDLIENRDVFVTRKIHDILGRSSEEIQAMGTALFATLLHPVDVERMAQHHDRIRSARYPDVFEIEYRMKHANGEWRWLRSRDVLFARLKDGTPSQILGTTEDITEHKLAEDALRESEHLLKEAQRAGGIGTYSWDILKNTWQASPELEALFGIGPDYTKDLKGWEEIVAPEWRLRMREYVQDLLARDQPFDMDYMILRPSDQAFRWVHGQGEIVKDASGNPLRLWGVIQDITERKRSEEALQSLATLLNRSQAMARTGGWEVDLRTGVLFWSDEMFRIHDMPVQAKPPSLEENVSMYTPECQGRIQDAIRRVIEHGEAFDLELEKLTARGRRIWVRIMAEAIREEGQAVKIVGSLQDITERRHAQEALREERRRLSDIIEGTRVGTWEWNVQTGELVLNERWAEIVGRTLDELEPIHIRSWVDLVHPADLDASNHLLDLHFAGENPYYECECRMHHKDGSWIWVMDRGKVVQWTEDGKPLRMSGTHTDITERKVVEEILLEREQRFRTLVENTEDAIVRYDREFRHLYANPAVVRFTGRKPAEFIGKTHREMGFAAGDPVRLESAIESVFESRRPSEMEFEWEVDGATIAVEWRLFPEFGPDGEVKTVLSIGRDITAQRKQN